MNSWITFNWVIPTTHYICIRMQKHTQTHKNISTLEKLGSRFSSYSLSLFYFLLANQFLTTLTRILPYLLPDFWEGGSIFFLQVSVVKVGEGRRRREASGLPQPPDVEPGHHQQHQDAQQVDSHLPAGWVPHHWNSQTSLRQRPERVLPQARFFQAWLSAAP